MNKFKVMKELSSVVKGIMIIVIVSCFNSLPVEVIASSHAEAPLSSIDRYADNTDLYAFRSYEAGRSNYVTLIANYIPFQDPSGGPQFYRFDDSVLYEINVDNTGDGIPDISYQFRFQTQTVNNNTVLGHTALNENGVVNSVLDIDYNMPQRYSVTRHSHNTGADVMLAQNVPMPPSNVGPMVTPNYETNLGIASVHQVSVNGTKIFAGQRDESFFADLGGLFDRLSFKASAPLTPPVEQTGGVDTLKGFNVNTIAIEVPISELTRSGSVPDSPTAADSVIGIWATASRQTTQVLGSGSQINSGNFVQVSRLGNPLVNELIIPLSLKDAFNASRPQNDSRFVPAILVPEFPVLLTQSYGSTAPVAPRYDLLHIFAVGIRAGMVPSAPNYTTFLADGPDNNPNPHEMMRLNVAIPPTSAEIQNRLGLLGNDLAGFPNGRRPADDVVDIELRAFAGGTSFTQPNNSFPNNALSDGIATNYEGFLNRFPYLAPPNPGDTPRLLNYIGRGPNSGMVIVGYISSRGGVYSQGTIDACNMAARSGCSSGSAALVCNPSNTYCACTCK